MAVGGHINFSLSLREVWGENPKEDHIRRFFLSHFEEICLVNVKPIKLIPTW
jgi:hypothetical protein